MKSMALATLLGFPLLAGCVADAGDPNEDETSSADQSTVPTTSSLWGTAGERWTPTSRLFDYSYAGYHHGEAPLPVPPVTVDIKKNFGAVGDGVHDDTQAFQKALANTPSGVIFVPAGHYVITDRIVFSKSHLVLRGASPLSTVLEFPKSLAEVDGKNPATLPTDPSPYAFGGDFITMHGSDSGNILANVTAGAKRGSKQLTVSTTANIKVGQMVVLVETDVNNTLIKRLYGDTADPGTDFVGQQAVNFHSPVVAVNGNTITLARPIPADVETRWTPQIQAFAPTLTESGIEHLTIRFKGTPYPGHFHEHGYNALSLYGANNCWVRDVQILNADLGITVNRSYFSTLTGVVLDDDFDRGAKLPGHENGHHGIWLTLFSGDVLVTGFNVKKKFIHDLSVEGVATGNVYSNGTGADINMDHHRRGPYGNLFTNINLGLGSRAFDSSGSYFRGAHSAAYSTFWDIRSQKPFALPTGDFGPLITFVGVNSPATAAPGGAPSWFVEKIDPAALTPANLQEAMRQKRLGQ